MSMILLGYEDIGRVYYYEWVLVLMMKMGRWDIRIPSKIESVSLGRLMDLIGDFGL